MREPDIKHDIKDYLNFPTKSRFSPEDLLRAAHERIDDLEEELEDMEYPDCHGDCDEAREAEDDAEHWEDEAGKLRAELKEAVELLDLFSMDFHPPEYDGDPDEAIVTMETPIGDLRRARSFLSRHQETRE